jgi:hypothetical protein
VRRGAASCRAVLAAVSWWRRSGPRRRCCHREPSWVAEHPRRRDPGEVGPPSGWSPVARMSGRRPGRSLPCPQRPVRRGDVRPAGRADMQRPRVRCPRVRCPRVRCPGVRCPGVRRNPGVRTDRPLVSAALPPRCPHAGPWSGSLWWAAPAGRGGSTCPWSAGGVVACRHRAGREGMVRRWPCLAPTRVDRSQGRRLAGVRLRRRLGPSGPTRALVQGQGAGRWRGAWDGASAHRPRQGVLGRSLAWWLTMAWTRRR